MLRKVIGWAVVAFIAFYLVTDPGGAAALVRSILHGLSNAGTSLATFFSSL